MYKLDIHYLFHKIVHNIYYVSIYISICNCVLLAKVMHCHDTVLYNSFMNYIFTFIDIALNVILFITVSSDIQLIEHKIKTEFK